jgi:hypothetical protein
MPMPGITISDLAFDERNIREGVGGCVVMW